MARLAFKAGEEYSIKLSELEVKYQDEIAKKAIYAGVEILADKIRENLEKVLSGESTGDLMRSFGVTPITIDKDGNYNAKIGFDGYGRDGVANQLKARVLESGTKDGKRKKKPFVRPAIRSKKQESINAMNRVIEEEIKKIMD